MLDVGAIDAAAAQAVEAGLHAWLPALSSCGITPWGRACEVRERRGGKDRLKRCGLPPDTGCHDGPCPWDAVSGDREAAAHIMARLDELFMARLLARGVTDELVVYCAVGVPVSEDGRWPDYDRVNAWEAVEADTIGDWPSEHPRIDLVVETPGVAARPLVVHGIASPDPVAPPVPAGSKVLARVEVDPDRRRRVRMVEAPVRHELRRPVDLRLARGGRGRERRPSCRRRSGVRSSARSGDSGDDSGPGSSEPPGDPGRLTLGGAIAAAVQRGPLRLVAVDGVLVGPAVEPVAGPTTFYSFGCIPIEQRGERAAEDPLDVELRRLQAKLWDVVA